MKKVIYIYPIISTFVSRDQEIIKSEYILKAFEFYADSKWTLFRMFIKQFFFLVKQDKSSSVIVCQFAGFHSVLPVWFSKISGKKILIITGGTDCVSFPSINYGNYRGGPLKNATVYSLKNATRISSIHEALLFSKNTFFIREEESLQGYKHYIPDIKTPDEIIYNGYDGERWYRDQSVLRDEIIFLTGVGKYYEKIQYLKGFDMIIQCAAACPAAKFVILGVNEDEKPEVFSDNVLFYPVQNREALLIWYNKATFYFQLSISEGFPNALCESMLCECIPIVSGVSSMPEIVEGSGFVVKKRSVEDLNAIVNKVLALKADEKENLSKRSRTAILSKYSLKNRRDKLLALIKRLS